MGKFLRELILVCIGLSLLGNAVAASGAEGGDAEGQPLGQDVAIREQTYAKTVTLPAFTLGGVTLNQDRNAAVPDPFKDPAARKCKPFCVQPDTIDGATTIKLEDFPTLAADMNAGKILLVDMRTPDWYTKETLPGAINLPYSDLTGPEAKAKARMKKLEGKDIIAFCNGWWCGQSPTGIQALKRLGYTGKIYYFRGGNQDWVDAGLPSIVPK